MHSFILSLCSLCSSILWLRSCVCIGSALTPNSIRWNYIQIKNYTWFDASECSWIWINFHLITLVRSISSISELAVGVWCVCVFGDSIAYANWNVLHDSFFGLSRIYQFYRASKYLPNTHRLFNIVCCSFGCLFICRTKIVCIIQFVEAMARWLCSMHADYDLTRIRVVWVRDCGRLSEKFLKTWPKIERKTLRSTCEFVKMQAIFVI